MGSQTVAGGALSSLQSANKVQGEAAAKDKEKQKEKSEERKKCLNLQLQEA